MNTKIIAAATLASLLSLTNTGASQAADSALTVKPLHGVSFDVGTKRAASYFVSENGSCKLVLTIADAPDWDGGTFSATRFEATVGGGKATQYKATEGKTLEFGCQADAQAMSITGIEQVAASDRR